MFVFVFVDNDNVFVFVGTGRRAACLVASIALSSHDRGVAKGEGAFGAKAPLDGTGFFVLYFFILQIGPL